MMSYAYFLTLQNVLILSCSGMNLFERCEGMIVLGPLAHTLKSLRYRSTNPKTYEGL